jgi:hypothetical protein
MQTQENPARLVRRALAVSFASHFGFGLFVPVTDGNAKP